MKTHRDQCRATGDKHRRAAFTLIEIMVVVGIMAIVLGAGIPSLWKLMHKEGFRKSMSDVIETCNAARADAIMHDSVATVVFHPQQGTFEGGGKSGKFENALIEMLDVNLREYKDADVARVRFFPNGRCDEMTLIVQSDRGEWRKISLEITTGMATIDSDPNKWR